MRARQWEVYVNENMPDAPPAGFRLRNCVEQLHQRHPLDYASIVDLGCNLGQLCHYLVDRFPLAKVHGVEFDITTKHDGKFFYQAHDLSQGFPYIEQSMDAVFALEILEHFNDTDFFLSECYRILKPGGWLVLTTPNICGYRNRWRVPLGLYPHGLEYKMGVGHVKLYNRQALYDHLIEHQFRNVKVGATHLLPSRLIETNQRTDKVSHWLANLLPGLGMNLEAFAER